MGWSRRLFVVLVLLAACPVRAGDLSPGVLPIHAAGIVAAPTRGGVFRNLDPGYTRASYAAQLHSLVFGRGAPKKLVALPSMVPDLVALRENRTAPAVTWVGHSTLLVQLDGVNFLTDPTWANRSGPFGGLVGVARFTPPPLRIEDLPPIDFVVSSPDHYDHLDEPTVRKLAEIFNPRFVVPLGLGSWLADRKITNVVELDWGESTVVKGLTIVCTPAQHLSGRTLLDQGHRLWSSWAVLGSKRFYFAGDTGYYRHFKDIGDAFGPFDLAALPIGSYTPRELLAPVHISPEEALQAWLDLRASHFVGIHWGTFGLAREAYDEPPKRIAAEIDRRGLDRRAIWILEPGETARW